MKIYRTVWLLATAAAAIVGVSVMMMLSPPAFVFLFVSFGLVTSVVSGRFVLGSRQERLRKIGTAALLGGSAASGFVGLGVVLGGGVLLLVAFLVVSSPATIQVYGRWLAGTSGDGVRHLDEIARAISYAGAATYAPVLGPPPPSDQELRQAWQSSYLALQQVPTVSQAMAIVEERALQLTEFERRNPAGFMMWLASGASAAGIPSTYLVERHADHPAIDWDALISGQEW